MYELSSDLNHDEKSNSFNKQIELSEIVSVSKDLTYDTAGGVIKQFMNMSCTVVPTFGNKTKRSYAQLDPRKQVIAF